MVVSQGSPRSRLAIRHYCLSWLPAHTGAQPFSAYLVADMLSACIAPDGLLRPPLQCCLYLPLCSEERAQSRVVLHRLFNIFERYPSIGFTYFIVPINKELPKHTFNIIRFTLKAYYRRKYKRKVDYERHL